MPNYTLYKMAISDFQKVCFLTPKNQKFDFSNRSAYKIIIFEDIQKPEYMLQKYAPTTGVQNFEPVSLFLAMQWPQKPGKGNDASFFNSIFVISKCRAAKQMTFSES